MKVHHGVDPGKTRDQKTQKDPERRKKAGVGAGAQKDQKVSNIGWNKKPFQYHLYHTEKFRRSAGKLSKGISQKEQRYGKNTNYGIYLLMKEQTDST